jgi:hypothetical protein
MKLIKGASGRQSKIETSSKLRILASGLKITQEVVNNMGVVLPVKGEDDGERTYIHYATDGETGDIYIYVGSKEEGNLVGANQCFSNNGLKHAMLKAAGLDDNFDIKGGNSVIFEVAKEGQELDGTTYFKITFESVKTKAETLAIAEDDAEDDVL